MASGTEPSNFIDPEQRNICSLPLPLWLKIFSYLEERDRLALSVTCRTLYDLCMKSSVLWRSATITIGNKTTGSGIDVDGAALNQTEQSVLREHCHQMNDIKFRIKINKNLNFDKNSYSLLEDAAKCWPLLSLHVLLDVSAISGRNPTDVMIPKHIEQLLTTCLTSPSAGQLKTLLFSAPMWFNKERKSGLLEALKNAPFTSSLTSLYIMNVVLTSYDLSCELCRVVGRFPNLQELGIDLPNVCDTLLNNFPKQMKKMHIAVKGLEYFKEAINWHSLRASCPELNVALYFKGNCSYQPLPQILPSVVPVCEVHIMPVNQNRGYCSSELEILQLLPLYSNDLRELTCVYHSIQTMACRDKALISAVSQCPKLYHLCIFGRISSRTIITLAKMRKWIDLTFKVEHIVFDDFGDRVEGLQTLNDELSKILGRDLKMWKPQSVTQNSRTGLSNKPLQMKMCQTVVTV